MNATKRKFNALLSGIGNKSTTSLSSSKEVTNNVSQVDLISLKDIDTQAKKRRVSDRITGELLTDLSAKPTVVSAMPHLTHKKSASLATTTPLAMEAPKYAPWDRAEFLKRLKSFSNLTDWTPKPARVNEVEWAKRGWICQKFERVRCCLCNVEILVKLNRKEVDGKEEPVYVAQNIEEALVEKYVELIITSHDENCLWRKRGCDDSIFKLPLHNPQSTIQTLRERYDELCSRSDNLPYLFNMRPPLELDLDIVLSYLPQGFFKHIPNSTQGDEAPITINRVAFMMALFGWQGHTHDRLGVQLGSVSCQACYRVLGLWLFKSKEVNQSGKEMVGAAVNCLDVVKEHRDYCPWRNASSQNGLQATRKPGSTAIPGWEIVLLVLKNDFYLRNGKEKPVSKVSRPIATDDMSEFGSNIDDVEDIKSREEEDKKRWARLRRVKSLFNTKDVKKISRLDSKK